MEPVVIACGGCGTAIRIRRPEIPRQRSCPRCQTALELPVAADDLLPNDRPAQEKPPRFSELESSIEPSPRLSATGRTQLRRLSLPAAAILVGIAWGLWGDPDPGPSAAVRPSPRASSSSLTPQSQTVLAAKTPSAPSSPVHSRVLPDTSRPRPALNTEPRPESVLQNPELTIPDPPFAPAELAIAGETVEASVPPEDAEVDRPRPATGLVVAPAVELARYKVRDENGQPMVARLHGRHEDRTVLMLPDGQLGFPTMLIPTDEPFHALSADELLAQLRQGPLGAFQVLKTPHYLIFYRSTYEFAETSGQLLEDLYKRLLLAFRKHEMPVHEAEFPLVAVIYRTERDFRASKPVAPEVQAFYEIFTNRIHFYETSERDEHAPEVAALRKPQTVAHEGTHQILQNIGIHPRLSSWPTWLIEGLAEYCATPQSGRKGKPTWDGLGMINGLHMATIRELEDPLSAAIRGKGPAGKSLIREPGKPLAESLIRKTQLTPTEYALAWAMTHYLAFKRGDEFIEYLRVMSQSQPLETRTPEEQLAVFRSVFGQDLVKVDKAIDAYLRKLAKQKGYDPMPYYAVLFQQPLGGGMIQRAARVSQSPQMIQQWIAETTHPQGGQVSWQALPNPTYARAVVVVEEWMHGS